MKAFGPNEVWDEHPKPWWHPVLDEARARGWTLKRYSGHSWGGIFCPAGECIETPIFSSPKGSESFAKKTMRKVKRCPHRAEEQSTVVAEVTDRLDAGERFADAADGLLRRDADLARVEELLTLAEQSADVEADLELEFDLVDQSAVQHSWRAEELLSGTPLDGTTEPSPVVAQAEVEVTKAGEALGSLTARHERRQALIRRKDTLLIRIEGLKVQVNGDPSDRD